MKDLKSKISMRSIYGLKSLTRIFKAMDTKGDGNLDCDDFRWGLMDFGVQVSKDEASELLNVFTADGGASVCYPKFLDSFRGACSDARKECIQSAYAALGKENNGDVRLDDIAKAFDPTANPDVASGARSDQEIFMEFMNLWDTQVKDALVSAGEFGAFHEDVSSLVDDDKDFETYMKSAFKC